MLNASALNCKSFDSPTANRLPNAKSKLMKPGPRTAPTFSFPKVAAIGYEKALVLNHWVRVFGPLALPVWLARSGPQHGRSEEHTSDSSHSQISYAVFCLKKKNNTTHIT